MNRKIKMSYKDVMLRKPSTHEIASYANEHPKASIHEICIATGYAYNTVRLALYACDRAEKCRLKNMVPLYVKDHPDATLDEIVEWAGFTRSHVYGVLKRNDLLVG